MTAPIGRGSEGGVSGAIGHGFGELLLDALSFIGLGLGGGQAAAAGFLQRLQQAALQEHGDTPLTADELATAVVKNTVGADWATGEARKWGMTASNFAVLVGATGDPPGPQELLEMWRRHVATEADVEQGLRQGHLRNEWIPSVKAMFRVLLSPADAVQAAVQNHYPLDTAAEVAAQHGISRDDFDVLYETAGDPPGPMELLTLWRRGIIDQATFTQGVRESRIKNKYVDQLAALFNDPLSPAAAVQAAVQGHLSIDEAARFAAMAGVPRAEFDVLYETAGNPPGPVQLLNLWVRGYIDEATVDQGLRESRLKNKYIPALKALAVHKLPMRTITMLLTHGAISDESATAHLRELGFNADDAAALVTAAHFEKAAPHKELSVTAIRTLYAERVLSREQAITDLGTAGYKPDVAGQLLDLADATTMANLRRAAIGKVRAIYIAHRLPRVEASVKLDELGVPPNQRDHMLNLWDLEEEANVAVLTPAQIVNAGKRGLIGAADVLDRLTRHGYSVDDAQLLAMMGGALPAPNTTR